MIAELSTDMRSLVSMTGVTAEGVVAWASSSDALKTGTAPSALWRAATVPPVVISAIRGCVMPDSVPGTDVGRQPFHPSALLVRRRNAHRDRDNWRSRRVRVVGWSRCVWHSGVSLWPRGWIWRPL
ncbi:Uncharacterised protein [Mycobacteroides abscessus subsp. abscessus]|nr:Uncharacterised protein [Mycobacteroides abscessus subsp. abscessus]